MRFGLGVQNHGVFGDPALLMELARDAEVACWDGFFTWDHLHLRDGIDRPFEDPTITVAAIAVCTPRIRIGTLVTSPARRRTWKLAPEVVALDILSAGRLTLSVGPGWADGDHAPSWITSAMRATRWTATTSCSAGLPRPRTRPGSATTSAAPDYRPSSGPSAASSEASIATRPSRSSARVGQP